MVSRRSIHHALHAALVLAFTFSVRAAEGPGYVRWCTYLGGGFEEAAVAVGADAQGNVFVGGYTASSDFLEAAGFEVESQGLWDAVVVKLAPDGSEILAVFAIGGPGDDAVWDLKVANTGDVFVVGDLASGFVPAEGACPSAAGVAGPRDVFVARLDNELELQTLQIVGGAGDDVGTDIDVDENGVVSILGGTTSRDLPATPGAFQERFQGGTTDYFIARLDLRAGSECEERLLYLTYLGSPANEDTVATHTNSGLVADAHGLVTVAGVTQGGPSYPRSPDAYRSPSPGGDDIAVTQLVCNPGLPRAEQLRYSTVLGGTDQEKPKWVGVTAEGTIQVVGWTWSPSFPATGNTPHHGENDIFVTEIDPAAAGAEQLRFSELLGGSSYDPPGDCIARPDGSIIIGGITGGGRFPTTVDALGPIDGTDQAFLLEWHRDFAVAPAQRIRYSTALTTSSFCDFNRGLVCNRVWDLALAPDGNVLACGGVATLLLGDTEGGAQGARTGATDMFVCRLDLRSPEARYTVSPEVGMPELQVTFDASASVKPQGPAIFTYRWEFGDSEGAETQEATTSHTYGNPGRYQTRLTVCNELGLASTVGANVTVLCPAGGNVSPWTAADVGEPGFPGAAWRVQDPQTWLTVCAGGRYLAGASDRLHFVYQEVTGDTVLSARLLAADGAGGRWQIGVMLRESLEATARHAAMVVRSLSLATQPRYFRYARVGTTTGTRGGAAVELPDAHVRIERQGDDFIALASADGSEGSYTELDRVTILDFPASYLAGLVAIGDEGVTGSFAPLSATVAGLSIDSASVRSFRRGDCNDDGTVDISDAVCILTWLFLGGATPGCVAATDTNGDAGSDISDATFVLNHLFLGGLAPVMPYPDCGPGALPTDEATCEAPPNRCQE